MDTSVVLFTAAFLAYGLMDVLGLMPQEITSAGLTLPGLFSKYFGDVVSSQSYVCETPKTKHPGTSFLVNINVHIIMCKLL